MSALPRFVWSDRSIRFLFFGVIVGFVFPTGLAGAPKNVQTLTQNGTSKPFA